MLTRKEDWLNDFLAENGAYVSGHPSFAHQLGISGAVTVRFVKLNECVLYFLAIQPIQPDYQAEYLAAFEDGKLNWLRELFFPLIQVFYTEEGSEFDLFFPDKKCFRKFSFAGLTNLAIKYHAGFGQNVGVGKKINRSINDTFQLWTRTHLNAYCIVNDLDAFSTSQSPFVFIELKRVVQSLDGWLPYLDDVSNFNAQNLIAQQRAGIAITLAYQADNENQIAYHAHISPNKREFIDGQFKLISPTEIARDLLAVDLQHAPRYRSTRWHQKPSYLS